MSIDVPQWYSGEKLHNYLENWRKAQNISASEMCRQVGWVVQYYSALNKPGRKVKAKTLLSVSEKLNIPLMLLLKDRVIPSEIFGNYPVDVLEWLASAEGKEIMLKEYSRFKLKEAQEALKEHLEKVADTVYDTPDVN